MFEFFWKSKNVLLLFLDQEKVSDYEIKLMDIDAEHLGIPVSMATVFMYQVWKDVTGIVRTAGASDGGCHRFLALYMYIFGVFATWSCLPYW